MHNCMRGSQPVSQHWRSTTTKQTIHQPPLLACVRPFTVQQDYLSSFTSLLKVLNPSAKDDYFNFHWTEMGARKAMEVIEGVVSFVSCVLLPVIVLILKFTSLIPTKRSMTKFKDIVTIQGPKLLNLHLLRCPHLLDTAMIE